MELCPSCGEPLVLAKARFCPACGASLAQDKERHEDIRKNVTILFCDVTGSTALGEQLDPESLRQVMTAFFGRAKEVVERHGGTLEKYIGDAIMAVFGVPRLHEDDPLRAVRAALQVRESVAALNEDLQRTWGVTLALRTGIN